ncbi:uncharacterized protein N7515_000418 [Penicillium bovifimosum]|uniref:Uncharacterized protein n=1 Tax=Penicillium bovifimosum TaxID=126998 RepID=A0A9W9L9V3_9EURO|nr:uncharacterized protein N7515_000418 [Penicillium bovifimosum]KAJ5145854.1 hypothetical protein N7515_000418 [Penicillium bovifimosum]
MPTDLYVETGAIKWGSWNHYDRVRTAGLGEFLDENSVIALYNKHGFLVGNLKSRYPARQTRQTNMMAELWITYAALKARLFNNEPVESSLVLALNNLDPNFIYTYDLYESYRIEHLVYARQIIAYNCRNVLDMADTQGGNFELSYRPDKRRCVPVFHAASRA